MDLVRLFVSLSSPSSVQAAVFELVERLRSANADIRWEPRGKLHCTVKFLGPTSVSAIPGIDRSLKKISEEIPPFPLSYGSLGFFPTPRAPRVIWIGIDDTRGILGDLQKRIDTDLSKLGVVNQTTMLASELTLGRVRGGRNLSQLLAMTETLTFSSELHTVDSFSLMRSDLQPAGSVYTQEKSFPLIGKP